MLVDIPRGEGAEKRKAGTWMLLLAHTPEPEYRAYWSAIVFCPDCWKPLSAVRHTIAENGQISPSLGHPTAYPPCGWHTNPRLLGWTPTEWGFPPQSNPETCAKCGTISHSIGGWGTWNGPGIICVQCFKEVLQGSADSHS